MLRIAVPTNRPEAVVNYLNALEQLGARGEAGREFNPQEYDGLLLPGGWDVNPSRYGKERIPEETVDDDLDELQFQALRVFLKARKPVFGICRGHQLLNVAFGGTLVQHLPDAEKHMSLPSGEDNVHTAWIRQDSFLHRIYGDECTVNSSHHQAVDLPGKGLKIVMRSESGVPEAAEHEFLPVWGVQWHPERMCCKFARKDAADGSLVFRFFLDKCRELHGSALTKEEQLKELYLSQKHTLDQFLERGAISQEQYDHSLGDLAEKMGITIP